MEIRDVATILCNHPFFSGMDKSHIDFIAGCGVNKIIDKGRLLAKENDPADHFFVVRKGKLLVEIHVPGRGEIGVQSLTDGDIIGWSWLFPPYRWSYDVLTVENTRLIALDGKCLRDKCDEDQVMGYQLMKRFAQIMTQRLEATRLQLLDMYGKPV